MHARVDPGVHRINLAWLVRLRWGAVLGQLATIAAAHFALRLPQPWLPLSIFVAIEAGSNLVAGAWVRRGAAAREAPVLALLALDVLLLSGIFIFTGGPANPFSFLYLVYIALGVVVLRPRWAWALTGLAFVCFGALFVLPLPESSLAGEHAGHGDHMGMHVRGMWIGFGVAAAFIVYFISRVTRDLALREAELAEARARAMRNEKLASLATLAAGAAHELASPLSTIAVASKELAREIDRPGVASGLAEDARLIRQEVERCRRILATLAADAGEAGGAAIAPASPREIARAALVDLPDAGRVEVRLHARGDEPLLATPTEALARALRGVVKNALEADPRGAIELSAAVAGGELRLTVQDRGPGMTDDVRARAGDPFFTTKEPGKGMGLGLFLARSVCEQMGGRLEIESAPGRGARVAMILPLGDPATSGRIPPREAGA